MYLIDMNNYKYTRCGIIPLLILIGCFTISLYFLIFHDGLSNNQDDWGNFGAYIGGIASIFNVIIFTWLTISIQKAGDEERKNDREHSKLLLITHIRKEEIINLERVLNDVLQITDLYLPTFYKFQNARSYLLNYAQSHNTLFPILNDKYVQQIIIEASDRLEIMRVEAMKSLGYDANGIKITDEITPISNTFTDASKEFQRLKIALISKLEGYIVNQINY